MKLKVVRFIAILILVIPGVLTTFGFGFLHMKDALFLYFSQFGHAETAPSIQWGKFLLGFVEFAAGVGFISWHVAPVSKSSEIARNKQATISPISSG